MIPQVTKSICECEHEDHWNGFAHTYSEVLSMQEVILLGLASGRWQSCSACARDHFMIVTG